MVFTQREWAPAMARPVESHIGRGKATPTLTLIVQAVVNISNALSSVQVQSVDNSHVSDTTSDAGSSLTSVLSFRYPNHQGDDPSVSTNLEFYRGERECLPNKVRVSSRSLAHHSTHASTTCFALCRHDEANARFDTFILARGLMMHTNLEVCSSCAVCLFAAVCKH